MDYESNNSVKCGVMGGYRAQKSEVCAAGHMAWPGVVDVQTRETCRLLD